MTLCGALRPVFFSLLSLFLLCAPLAAQSPATTSDSAADLQLVVILTRHGVRSPLTPQADLDKFSAAPWPKWDVAPGHLTAHGYDLMKLFGAWDRIKLSGEGLLAPTGCADATRVTILADVDQRTRETGKALAEGLLPGCDVAVHSQPDGKVDPFFRPLATGASNEMSSSSGWSAGIGHADSALAVAAISGRIGGDPNNLTEAYRRQANVHFRYSRQPQARLRRSSNCRAWASHHCFYAG